MIGRGLVSTLCWAVFTASVVLYAAMAINSPLGNVERYREAELLTETARMTPYNQACEARLSRLYWDANPDVAESDYFGDGGQLGIPGAREHFNRHGRREERLWPEARLHCTNGAEQDRG